MPPEGEGHSARAQITCQRPVLSGPISPIDPVIDFDLGGRTCAAVINHPPLDVTSATIWSGALRMRRGRGFPGVPNRSGYAATFRCTVELYSKPSTLRLAGDRNRPNTALGDERQLLLNRCRELGRHRLPRRVVVFPKATHSRGDPKTKDACFCTPSLNRITPSAGRTILRSAEAPAHPVDRGWRVGRFFGLRLQRSGSNSKIDPKQSIGGQHDGTF
jgi:hypothetical protein